VLILPGSGGTVSFKYDPFGGRIYKSSSAGTSIYAYDNDNLVEETSSAGTATARYAMGLNIDEPLVILQGTTTDYYQADGLGACDLLRALVKIGMMSAWMASLTRLAFTPDSVVGEALIVAALPERKIFLGLGIGQLVVKDSVN
jgi:hypothetical protein